MEQNKRSSNSDPLDLVVQVSFPVAQASVLDSLNRQREEGHFCDLSIHVQGQVFKAHRCVMAASSSYFHDQVLLKNMSSVTIPAVMDPLAFESVLRCAYTGQLRMLRDDIVNYLTVGSVLQMWHIVDKCTELLREAKGGSSTASSTSGPRTQQENPVTGVCSDGANPSGGTPHYYSRSDEPQGRSQASFGESQSPSSTNYFSPQEGSSGRGPASGRVGDGQGTGYCAPSSRDEAFLIEDDDDEEQDVAAPVGQEDDEELQFTRVRSRLRARRKRGLSGNCDSGVGVSDRFGVSSYQGRDSPPPLKRTSYSQPSIMPHKQWVVVKTERSTDDELIVVSGEEGGGDEEDEEDEKELLLGSARERVREKERTFGISNVKTLSDELNRRAEGEIEGQDDFCHSSEDYLKFDSGLTQNPFEGNGQGSRGPISTLLGPLTSVANRAHLFSLDMQGNQILMYNQSATMDSSSSSPLEAGSGMVGSTLKAHRLDHGAVQLSGQGVISNGLEGLDGMASDISGGPTGKAFICHCGKTFTHKSMRDRHINMHLDLRPFQCPMCAKRFKMKHHLTEHMKTHTGLKPFDCHGCGKKFMWRDSFMRHRSQCERHDGGPGDHGDLSSQDLQGLSPNPNPLHSDTPLTGSEGRGSVGRASSMSPHHSAGSGSSSSMSGLNMAGSSGLLGVGAQSMSSSVFGLGVGRDTCEDEVCEVSVEEGHIP